jgi:hypothetical protein
MSAGARLACALLGLGLKVRDQIMSGRDPDLDPSVVSTGPGDTVFAIDRRVEPLILASLNSLPPDLLPVLVVCEGLGADGRALVGGPGTPQYRILVDPVDGSRGLAYDKRAAWFLAAVAPDAGEETCLSGAVASVMVELPTSKQGRADHFIVSPAGWLGARRDLTTGVDRPLVPRPSAARSLRNGFGHVANFFPGTKTLAAELMEQIAEVTLGFSSVSEALIYDDQYISTGGQLVELMMGHDRFCCDLRPIFYQIRQLGGGAAGMPLACHPYDLAGLPVARGAGVLVTDGFGNELDPKFEIDRPMHWCGYANAELRAKIEPVITSWLREKLSSPAVRL